MAQAKRRSNLQDDSLERTGTLLFHSFRSLPMPQLDLCKKQIVLVTLLRL